MKDIGLICLESGVRPSKARHSFHGVGLFAFKTNTMTTEEEYPSGLKELNVRHGSWIKIGYRFVKAKDISSFSPLYWADTKRAFFKYYMFGIEFQYEFESRGLETQETYASRVTSEFKDIADKIFAYS